MAVGQQGLHELDLVRHQLLDGTIASRCSLGKEGRSGNRNNDGCRRCRAGRHFSVEVRGNRVLVRPADDEPPPSDDVLSQPIESLGLDSLEDPLA